MQLHSERWYVISQTPADTTSCCPQSNTKRSTYLQYNSYYVETAPHHVGPAHHDLTHAAYSTRRCIHLRPEDQIRASNQNVGKIFSPFLAGIEELFTVQVHPCGEVGVTRASTFSHLAS